MSTTWKAFENEIIDLCSDVRSSKVPVRTKAIDRIDQILNSREQEIFELFDREIEVSWIEFFESVSDGMIKVRNFENFLKKIIYFSLKLFSKQTEPSKFRIKNHFPQWKIKTVFTERFS